MWVADPSADETNDSRIVGGLTAPHQSIFVDPYDPTQEVGWLDSLAASAMRENTITSLGGSMSHNTGATDQEIEQAHDDGFNPYSYLRETYAESDLADVMPYIIDGELEETYSGRQVEAILADLRRELAQSRTAAANPGAAFLGGIVAAVGDPTSYIPVVGPASRVGRLGSLATIGANAALSTSVSELALQSTQRTRTLEETLLNIGTAGLIGGGLGYFIGANYRSNLLHPDHPDNPLRVENLRNHPEVVRTADGELDELSAAELRELREEVDSINAARVEGRDTDWTQSDTQIARSEPQTRVGRALRSAGDFFNTRTIVGRVVRAASPEARRLGLSLMDPGGTLLRGHLNGKAMAPAAEDIKHYLMVRAENLSATMRQSVVDLRVQLGKRIDEADVYRLTQRTLFNMEDRALAHELVRKYGQSGFDRMMEKARANAEAIHKTNDDFEQMMVQRGILQDSDTVARLESELESAKAEVERLKAEEVVDEAALGRARAIRDDRRSELFQETSKPAPMGREYGHAQLWNRDAIIETPDEFRAFLRDALLDQPETNWLQDAYQMTPAEFRALRESDRAQYDRILEDWAGDAFYHRLTQRENAHKAAVEADKQSVLDLNDALRALGILRRENGQVTLSQARKFRDKANTDLEAARQSKARAEADLRAYRQGIATSERMAKAPLEIRLQSKRQVAQQARDTGRLKELMAQVQRETKRMKTLAERQERVDAALAKADARRAEIQRRRQALDDLLEDLRAQGRVTSKDLRKAKRQLRAAQKATPLDDLIDEVYDNLVTTGRVPHGIMDRIGRESDRTTGRVKERTIQLNGEQRMAGIQRGWLKDDLPQVLFNQYDQVSAELAIREALEIGPGQRYSSWGDRLKAVEEDYNDMIAGASDRATKDRLRRERDTILDDLVSARDRIRGAVMSSDGTTHGWANWLSSKVRSIQFARFGGGFLFSSMTDAATMSLRTGGFGKALRQYGRQSARAAFNMHKGIPHNDIEAFVASMELGIGAAAHARRFGSEDLVNGPYGSHGIGSGNTRRVTGAIDQGMGWVNEKVGLLSGLPLWNRTMKIMAGHMMSARIRDSVGRFDNLSKAEIADLASVGIGRAEARRLHGLIQKHGSTVDGRFDPGLSNWPAADARTFLMAIQRDMNRAINTPGVGDTPRLMDTWWGKLWLQFQTFSFTFINRYAYPTAQRIALGDRKAMASAIWLMGAASMVVAFKDILRGNDPTERYREGRWGDTAYEILDRSGLMAWTSPYVDSALKLGGFGGLERYARQGALTGLAGVNAGFLSDVNQAAIAAIDADPNVLEKILVLLPMSTQTRLFNNLMTE